MSSTSRELTAISELLAPFLAIGAHSAENLRELIKLSPYGSILERF
ncbi:hypothetical protein [Planctopirus ephydatiae]|nr:hypothetical protein [Planctopirus ephydatiae]